MVIISHKMSPANLYVVDYFLYPGDCSLCPMSVVFLSRHADMYTNEKYQIRTSIFTSINICQHRSIVTYINININIEQYQYQHEYFFNININMEHFQHQYENFFNINTNIDQYQYQYHYFFNINTKIQQYR